MKKSLAAIFGVLMLSAVFTLTGCLADAVADDGTGYPVNSGSGGTGWALCKNSAYDIFELQVWGDNGAGHFVYENKSDCGRFTVDNVGAGWIGGGLICADSSKSFDFSSVSKIKFEIRGTIASKALCIVVQGKKNSVEKLFPDKKALNQTASISALNTEDWQTVEFNVSDAASYTIINTFCIIAGGDIGSPLNKNDYFEIRNLDWVDSDGNSVNLSLK